MRFLRTLTVAVALLSLLTGCTRASGSREKFCAALPDTEDLFALIGNLDATDSARLEQRLDAGVAEFSKLERAAPRKIRSDVADVADVVERILEAVKKHPTDMGAVRQELAGSAASLLGSGKAALQVSAYAQRECGITLGGGAAVTGSTDTAPTTTVARATSTTR